MSEETTATNEGTTEDPKATPAATGDDGSNGSGDGVIPKARLDAEIAKRREAQKAMEELTARLSKFEQAEKAAADEAAKRAGDVETAQKERDTAKAELEQWRKFANDKLEALTEALDEAGQGILADLGDDTPLAKRLRIAEKLATQKKTEPGFGTKGGKGQETGGLIPAGVSSGADYHAWLAQLNASNDGRKVLLDKAKMAEVRAEARRKKFI